MGSFFVVAGKLYYDRKKKVPVVCLAGCAVVSVFRSRGKLAVSLLWRESFITTGKKKFQSSVWPVVLLCQFLVLAITTGKKVPVVCLAGCAVVSVFGSGDYDRKKKVPVVCLAGCAVVSVFGSGNYDRKKSSSCLSGGLCYVTNLY